MASDRLTRRGVGKKGPGYLKPINLRMRLGTNFFNIMLNKFVPSLILKLISLRLQHNC